VAFRPWRWGGSRSPSMGGLRFLGFRVKVWCGGAQMAAVASSPIKSPRLQPHLGGEVEKFVGVVWFSRTSGWGDLRISMELHRRLFLLLRPRDGCGLLDPFCDFQGSIRKKRSTNNLSIFSQCMCCCVWHVYVFA
jgi:hypothetical protein